MYTKATFENSENVQIVVVSLFQSVLIIEVSLFQNVMIPLYTQLHAHISEWFIDDNLVTESSIHQATVR